MSFRVEIDALVLLKIQKHCRDATNELSTGVLLGFDVQKEETVLQVTNCFASIGASNDENIDQDDIKNYQDQMISQMTNTKMDGNVVGWYSSVQGDSYLSDSTLLESQFDYQKNIPQSVVIVYDPIAFTQGKLPFKVLQVTEEFMKFRTAANESRLPLDLSEWPTGAAFLQEVPFEVANSALVDAFVINYLLKEPTATTQAELESSEQRVAAANSFLATTLNTLSTQLDAIEFEQKSVSSIAKRAIQSGGRDLKKHRDEIAFECGAQSLTTMIVAHQTDRLAEEIQKAAVVAKQCLAKLN